VVLKNIDENRQINDAGFATNLHRKRICLSLIVVKSIRMCACKKIHHLHDQQMVKNI